MRESETDVLEYNTYPVAAQQEDYQGAGEAIREVQEYMEECRDFCENPHQQKEMLRQVQ